MAAEAAEADFYLFDALKRTWNQYMLYLLTPVAIAFLLPVLTCAFIYFSAIFLKIHKARLARKLKEAVLDEGDISKAGREIICSFWDAQGWLFHGYEVHGIENIPETGGALIIYYHGALPVDYYYLVAKVALERNRAIHCVVDSLLFKIPGLSGILQAFCCTPGTIASCAADLKEGNLLGLSPGGVYEAQFSDHRTYNIMWKNRTGFAKIALQTGVPIIPVFTQNIRECFRTVGFFRRLFMKLYNKTRFPVVPVYGNFPVKLRTFVGKPVDYDPSADTPETVRDKTRAALQELIDTHQRKPGSICRALIERFKKHTS